MSWYWSKPRPAQDLCRRVSDLTRRHQNKIPRMWILSGILRFFWQESEKRRALSSSEFCVSSSMSQSIILTTGPKARNGKTKLASCRAELPRAESPFLAAGPCTSSTRLSPQPETIRNHVMSERCKCIANTLRCSLWLSWIQELGWQYWESKAFLLKLSQCSWVPHGSAWFCVRSSSQGQMVSDLRLWPPAELDPLQLQAL